MRTTLACSILMLMTATACTSNVDDESDEDTGEAEGALEVSTLETGIYEYAQFGSSVPPLLLVAKQGSRTVVVQPDSMDCKLRYAEPVDEVSHRASAGRGCDITLVPIDMGDKAALKVLFLPVSPNPEARKRDEAAAPIFRKRADNALRGAWTSIAAATSVNIESSTDDRIVGTVKLGATPVTITAKRPADWLERGQAQTYPFQYNVSFIRETCRGELRVSQTPRRKDQAIEVRFATCGSIYESSTVFTRSGYVD